ncbi:MAG: nitrite/sulfite reductase [SAR202 cluster bacterium]|jgi:sulfite reductase beta subunit-like hemoprotein|nr:nitrite/sulfite reductase [SAR202 cluster bacterium]HAL46861.1 ferredoxin--nitrite reductase [Dehalococcoidia bacterium]MDP6664633.1 nitrite/sulfite reductase [SAR202 cluster bacterium]MDP6798506.1 nitrite/sulfite reductase [SAR202 cluster bacterium]MQG58360.1 nitrite/sulfite reductase [SAR202 cluster bacterium]|tara:strand:- start:7324 stop:9078 length:1755 start_codon:yes stop_codon:yes gene_type:complete
MVETTERPKGVIDILPEELDDFQNQVKRFHAGEWIETDFMAFRLRQGVYGQRQPDVHMVRVKIPFGGLTADQLDMLGDVTEQYVPLKKGHVTTRECIQFHHVPLEDAAELLQKIGSVGLTTREACGNTVRNVTGCPLAGVCGDEPFDVTPYAAAFSRYFVRHPYTQAMPRKFKTAFSGCEKDCAITSIHDVGFIPKVVDGQRGFKMVAGGSTAIMARVAQTLYDFVPIEDYLRRTEAVIRVFFQSDELRKNRSKARMKFLIERIGMDEFRKLVEAELNKPWARRSFDPTPLLFLDDESVDAPALDANYASPNDTPEYRAWLDSNVTPQKQGGYMAVAVKLPLGDIQSEQFHALAEVSRRYAGSRVRLTAQQNLTFRWVPERALPEIWEQLKELGFGQPGADEIGDVLSCPGTDSCKLGITSSMGLAGALIEALDSIDTSDPLIKKMHIKMSGCPNGCGHHHIGDIGFHGAAAKGPGGQVPAYDMFVGGTYRDGDTRFGQRVKVKIPAKRVPEALSKTLDFYKAERLDGEEFQDFVVRVGPEVFEPVLSEFKDVPSLNRDTLVYYMDWNKTIKYVVERGEGECAV